MTVTLNLMTVRGMKIIPLQLGITVTTCLCITAAHFHQSTNFSNGCRILLRNWSCP